MLGYSLKYAIRKGSTWKLLTVLIITATTGSFLLFTSLTDSLYQNQVNIEKYNRGYVTLFSGYNPPVLRNATQFTEKAKTVYMFTDNDVTDLNQNASFSNVFKITVARFDLDIDGEELTTGLIGVNTEAEAYGSLPYANIWSGTFISQDQPNGVIISSDLSEKIGLKQGNTLKLNILGDTHTFNIQGVYGHLLPSELDPKYSLVMDQSLFWQVCNETEHRYNGLLVQLTESSNADNSVGWLNNRFKNAYVVYQHTQAMYSMALIESTRKTYSLMNTILLFLSSVIFVAVRVLDMHKRRQELGIFMTFGWREKDIINHIIIQATVLATIGLAAGISLVFLVGEPLTTMLIPAELKIKSLVNLTMPNPRFIPNTVGLCVILSALGFAAAFLYLRNLSPLKLLEVK